MIRNSSLKLPILGQGMGAYQWNNQQIKIIQMGIDLGLNFIDTAENYDNGRSEEIIGKAVKDRRSKVIVGTKFSSINSSYADVIKAAEGSLCRLQTNYIDLYQMHWPNPRIPIEESLGAMEDLVKQGKVRFLGFGNVYTDDVKRISKIMTRERISTLQLEYNLFDRGVEEEILPYCRKNNIYLIGYTPLDRGRLVDGSDMRCLLEKLADKYSRSPTQIVLRWLTQQKNVVPIPKVSSEKHLLDNAGISSFELCEKDLMRISKQCNKRKIYVETDSISVIPNGEESRNVYTTLEQAKKNKMGFVPSPIELSQKIKVNDNIKPVRLVRNKKDKNKFYLIEGRIRYWAWVIAKGNEPIPALLREEWK